MLLAIETGLSETGAVAGYVTSETTASVPVIIGVAIKVALGAIGMAFLLFLIYGGILWLIAAGDTDKVKKARSLMINSTLAVLVIVASYALATFVIDSLLTTITT